jgi:hypothetical protein
MSSISLKNQTKQSLPEVCIIVVTSNFLVHFLGVLRILRSPFEINWPLVSNSYQVWNQLKNVAHDR